MEKNQATATEAPGADVALENALSLDTIQDFLRKDLSIAISCLNAIHTDPDLLAHMAAFMHGRMINNLNAKAQGKP